MKSYALFPDSPVYWDPLNVCQAAGMHIGKSRDFLRMLAEAQPGDLIVDFDVCLEPWDPKPGVVVAHYYSEALGSQDDMLPDHWRHLHRVAKCFSKYNALFVGCVGALEELPLHTSTPVYLWPITSADEITHPTLKPREYHIMFHGSRVGLRESEVPMMFAQWEKQGKYVKDVSGVFGSKLTDILRTTNVVWNPSHSVVKTVNMWRFWQATAAGAAWLVDDFCGNTWPAKQDLHYATRYERCHIDMVCESQALLRLFTPAACFESYVRPVWRELSR